MNIISPNEVEYYPLKQQALGGFKIMRMGPTTQSEYVERTVLGRRRTRTLKGWRLCEPSTAGKDIVLYSDKTFRIGQAHYDLKLRRPPSEGEDEYLKALHELVVVLKLEEILRA